MTLRELLAKKKNSILDRCLNLLLDTYPHDSVTLLKNQRDPFANPVGSTFRRELEAVLDGLAASVDPGSLTSSLDAIVRIRAVQDFRPSEALTFMAHLKKAVREQLQEEQMGGQALDDLAGHRRGQPLWTAALRALDSLILELQELREAIAAGNDDQLHTRLENARQAQQTWIQQRTSGKWAEKMKPVTMPSFGESIGRLIGIRPKRDREKDDGKKG